MRRVASVIACVLRVPVGARAWIPSCAGIYSVYDNNCRCSRDLGASEAAVARLRTDVFVLGQRGESAASQLDRY